MKAGWEVKPLGEVCTLATGGTPKRSESSYFEQGDIKWLVSGDVHQREIHDCEGRITELGLANSNARYLPENSVIIALNGQGKTRGAVALLRTKATCNQSLVSIMPNDTEKLLPEFLFANLHGRYEEIRRITGDSGNDRRGLNMPLIRSIEIPIAPLEEQKRIVAVLDAAFEGLTRANENAETNLQNARELFENTELGLFDKHTRNITETKLGDFADFRNGLNFSKNSTGQTIKIVGVGDFQDYFWMPLEQLKSVNIEGQLAEQDMIAEGDILAVRSNGNKELIGRVMLADVINEPTSFSGFTIRIRLNSSQVTPEYVCYFMKTKAMRKLLTAGGDGANISNLNQTLLSNLTMKVPSTEVQRVVVEEARALRASFDDLLAQYQSKLTDIADLRQSLLQKAFAGELT